jgi:hypothetical protein
MKTIKEEADVSVWETRKGGRIGLTEYCERYDLLTVKNKNNEMLVQVFIRGG